MQDVCELINVYMWKWPQFKYYLAIIEKAEKNASVHPDISIEASKAVIEGISKTIVQTCNPDITNKQLHKMGIGPVVRLAMEHLASYDDKFEDDFIRRCVSLVHKYGEVRNERGDISHGQKVPKEKTSTVDYARLVAKTTAGLLEYILATFFKIDFAIEKEEVEEEQSLYEKNQEFNEFLDEQVPIDDISYSEALFQQDLVAYEVRLEEFLIGEADR